MSGDEKKNAAAEIRELVAADEEISPAAIQAKLAVVGISVSEQYAAKVRTEFLRAKGRLPGPGPRRTRAAVPPLDAGALASALSPLDGKARLRVMNWAREAFEVPFE